MGGLNPFKKPKVSTPKVIETPHQDTTNTDVDAATQAELDDLKKRRGAASTVLTSTGVMGDDSSSSGLATRKLMGG